MKSLLLLLIVLGGVWLWRSRQVSSTPTHRSRKEPAPAPQDMLLCPYCGVHFPSIDAVHGQRGVYCSAEHQHLAEP